MLCCRPEGRISELCRVYVDRFWPLLYGPVGLFHWALVPPHSSLFISLGWTLIWEKKNYILYFKLTWFFQLHYGPGADSASNRNKYQDYHLGGGKGGRCVGLTSLPSSCADFLEILGASTSWSHTCLLWPVMGRLILNPSVMHAAPWTICSMEGYKTKENSDALYQ